MRTPSGNIGQVKLLQHLVHFSMPLQAWAALQREFQILAQGHVGKQRVILKHVAALTRSRRQADARRGIEQNLIIHQDAAFIRTHKSGEGIERQCFAGAAWAEENRDAFAGAELDIQREAGGFGAWREILAEARLDHSAVWRGPNGLVVRRLAMLKMISARAETITTSMRAVAPLPASTAS